MADKKRDCPRAGPRPLPLHLSVEMTAWTTARAALPSARFGILPWQGLGRSEQRALTARLAAVDLDKLTEAVDQEAWARFRDLSDGISAYQKHGYCRNVSDVPAVWEAGCTRLQDFGAVAEAPRRADLKPLLVVPSLVNRAYILDLSQRRSFMRYLVGRGFRPFLVDWGRPGPLEQTYGLDDYIDGTLNDILTWLGARYGPMPVLGYCMGGVLAMGLAALRPDLVSALVLMATPWDFHADNPTQFEIAAAFFPMLPAVLHIWGELPVEVLQALFASVDVFQIGRKFRRFADMPPRSAAARDFVATEDWLNDGIPLTRRVAVDIMQGWYVQNLPGRGRWRVGKQAVRPEEIGQSALIIVPRNDRIVPPGTALALGERLENATVMTPKAGHIGMVVGRRARAEVWAPIADWLGPRP